MLQQILQDMYIHPDILAELDEEQKQLLFCKMREEQVRKWAENEKKLPPVENKPKNGRRIQFLMASDGNPWTWVMGDHKDDKTIEEILEAEAQERARQEAEKEAEQLQREAEELAIKESMKIIKEAENLKLKDDQKNAEIIRKKKLDESQRIKEKIRRSSLLHINEVREQRENEIYSTLREMKEKISVLAEQGLPLMEEAWREQEVKAKKIDSEIRNLARRAREEHRRSVNLSAGDLEAVNISINNGPEKAAKPSLPKKPVVKPRSSRPIDRAAVQSWFTTQEEPKHSGLNPNTNEVMEWFHGIISRQDAELELSNKEVGSFLVRVSEKVYGYAVSFKSKSRCKHFLLDVTDEGYKLFGLNQRVHSSLYDLIQYHQKTPICSIDQETLLYPCPQSNNRQKTLDLFTNFVSESSYL